MSYGASNSQKPRKASKNAVHLPSTMSGYAYKRAPFCTLIKTVSTHTHFSLFHRLPPFFYIALKVKWKFQDKDNNSWLTSPFHVFMCVVYLQEQHKVWIQLQFSYYPSYLNLPSFLLTQFNICSTVAKLTFLSSRCSTICLKSFVSIFLLCNIFGGDFSPSFLKYT